MIEHNNENQEFENDGTNNIQENKNVENAENFQNEEDKRDDNGTAANSEYSFTGDNIIKDDLEPERPNEGSYSPYEHYGNTSSPYGQPIENDGFPRRDNGFNGYNANQYTVPKRKVKHEKGQNRKFSLATVIVSVVCAALVGAGSSLFCLYNVWNKSGSSSSGTSSVKNINVTSEDASVVEAVYEKCSNSVVGIRTTTSVMNFFGGSSNQTGEGSGIIYSEDGYIITNYHVISDSSTSSSSSSYGSSGNSVASKIQVYLPSDPETAIDATVVGYNASSDLAVIKINKKGLTPIEIGDSDSLKVGQFVVAIGNPGGLQFMGSVTYGVIGGLNRTLQIDSVGSMNLIQTDAAINPGNSGGALVDTSGKLIGINSSKLVNESYEGMGFAIPINKALEICKKIISNQGAPTPYLGVEISTKYTSDVLKYYGFPSGAVVSSVKSGSPAEAAGIQRGDIITKAGDTDITEYTVFNNIISESSVGDKITLSIYRSGQTITKEVTLGQQ